MKILKRGVTVLLVMALTLTLVTAASLNWTNTELGDLSQYYETGSVGQENARPGYISTVTGDAGGTSYGIYMFASKAGTPYAFAKWLAAFPEGDVYKTMGDILVNAYEYNRYGQYYPATAATSMPSGNRWRRNTILSSTRHKRSTGRPRPMTLSLKM